MQVQLTLMPSQPLLLPLNYNYALQSAIYAKLSEVGVSDFWHDSGFGKENPFKGFVFGRLSGNHSVAERKILFYDQIRLAVRSPLISFCEALTESLAKNPYLSLLGEEIAVCDSRVSNASITGGSVDVFCDSPVLASYSGPGGKKQYYAPYDEGFVPHLVRNYERKYEAIYAEKAPPIQIEPYGEHQKVVTNYKGTWLVAYAGHYHMEGSSAGLEFLYSAGLGSKNAQGFGLLEMC